EVTDQPAGVDTVHNFGHRADGPGEAEPLGDDVAELNRRRGDQPHALAGIEVQAGEGVRTRPDSFRHQVVEDLFAELAKLIYGPAGDEREGRLLGLGHVLAVLARGD